MRRAPGQYITGRAARVESVSMSCRRGLLGHCPEQAPKVRVNGGFASGMARVSLASNVCQNAAVMFTTRSISSAKFHSACWNQISCFAGLFQRGELDAAFVIGTYHCGCGVTVTQGCQPVQHGVVPS